jgi:6-phosphogluconolactonase (cycloisomerase 2 family)
MLLAAIATSSVLFACHPHDDDDDNGPEPPKKSAPRNMLYVTTNNPNGNAVVAYRRDSLTGALSMIGTYPTGGIGFLNPTANKLGPNDADQSLIVDRDHARLFAVNGGSNSIAVFEMNEDGSLMSVPGSPFNSGGIMPVSVGIHDSKLYVVNKNEDTLQMPNNDLPNYTAFHVQSDGTLNHLVGSTRNTLSKASPSQALVTPDGTLLFGADFLVPMTHPGSGSLRSFMAGAGLNDSPGSPQALPGDPMTALPLGLWLHPHEQILYVGFPARSRLGVYKYESSGALSYVTEVSNSGAAICWLRTNRDGSRLYSLNSLSNSISVYNTQDPQAPSEMQHFPLSYPGPMFTNVQGMMQITSGPFGEELSPDGRFLYTINQRQNAFSESGDGNNIHIVNIAPDGTVSETMSPVGVPTPANARPVGIAVL